MMLDCGVDDVATMRVTRDSWPVMAFGLRIFQWTAGSPMTGTRFEQVPAISAAASRSSVGVASTDDEHRQRRLGVTFGYSAGDSWARNAA